MVFPTEDGHFLIVVADMDISHPDAPAVRFEDSVDQLQDRGLSGSVAADQRDAFSLVNLEGKTGKKRSPAEGFAMLSTVRTSLPLSISGRT